MPENAPVAHPLGPPTLSGANITVDTMLNQPTRITRALMDLSQEKFIMDLLFTSRGGISGGAIVYDQQTENELYPTRDVEQIAPGASFPLVTGDRLTPQVATIEKWGGKFFVTDEARIRNNAAMLQNHIVKLSNALVKQMNVRAVSELDASITATGQSFVGREWDTVVVGGSGQSPSSDFPARDFAHAQRLADEQELGVMLDTVIMNPQEAESLRIVYGADMAAVLADNGINYWLSSPRVTAGSAYFAEYQMVGEVGIEKPLATTTWRDEDTERDWVKSGVSLVPYITNPYSVFKATGLHS